MQALTVSPHPDAERLRAFGEAIDQLRKEAEAAVGPEDLARVKRLDRFSRTMEVLGRGAIHFSFEPLLFTVGVLALWLHKQLQATEIGHTALHGAYDKLDGAERYASRTYAWDTPIDEESWRAGHNLKHHHHTNVAGRDPDIHFGPVRLTPRTPWASHHRFQLPLALLMLFPNFTFLMNFHFTGIHDVYFGNGLDRRGGKASLDVLPDLSRASIVLAHRRALRKYLPYYLKNYLFFPLLAGPGFAKVLLGNWLAETLRDVYSAATIYCGHVGEDVADFPVDAHAGSRGAWYAMEVAATNNFEVSRPISILCGGLDRQIEHHLFPRLPPERLRQIAPRVRAACEAHGIPYKTASWGQTLRKAFRRIRQLSREDGVTGVVRDMA